MNCEKLHQYIDDYLAGDLDANAHAAAETHLNACSSCQQAISEHRVLLSQLRALPIPPVSQGFNARMIRQAKKQGIKTQRIPRYLSGTLGAFLLVLVAVGVWQPAKNEAPALQIISMQVYETRTISLAFNSPEDIKGVTFTLELPKGLELEGRPKRTQIAWKNDLHQGKNVMNLKLRGTENLEGELVARITHEGIDRVFRIPLKVQGQVG